MTGQHEPDPNNRFETWADGMTPASHQPPTSGPSATEPSAWSPSASAPDPQPSEGPQSFPTYPYSTPSAPPGDPQQDEAFAAFQRYQANTHGFPHQAVQPHQSYQGPYGRGLSPYGTGAPPNAPYAVPSLVLGIVSVFCGVTGPIGLALGISALKQIESNARAFGGRGLAIAGIATSAFGTFMLLMLILGVISG